MRHYLTRFLQHLQWERHLSPYTARNYRTDLTPFFQFLESEGVQKLGSVDRRLLRRYAAWLAKERPVRLGKGLVRHGHEMPSVARKLSVLRSFYRYLVREKVVDANPVYRLSLPKLQKRIPSFLSKQEMGKLVEAPQTSDLLALRDRALLELLYAAGLRVSEIVGLDVNNVDLRSREVRVLGKGSKERVALMGKPALDALERYIRYGREELLNSRWTQPLFLNRYGGRLSVRSVQNIVRRYARGKNVSQTVHPHTIRHSFATHLLDGGADLRVVQALLGHESLSTTQVYTHMTTAEARKTYLKAHPRAAKVHPEPEGGPGDAR
ncbi:MAG: tyrosine recombinase [Dehalococcoidia bacterium]